MVLEAARTHTTVWEKRLRMKQWYRDFARILDYTITQVNKIQPLIKLVPVPGPNRQQVEICKLVTHLPSVTRPKCRLSRWVTRLAVRQRPADDTGLLSLRLCCRLDSWRIVQS
jgi:hypothetical protein